jgi:hypothetical protein
MKLFLFLLLFPSHILMAQRNVALLNVGASSRNEAISATVDFAEIPFELAGGMVIVKASVNGEMGNFILDTGAPGIVLNAHSAEIKAVSKASSVGGDMEIGEVVVRNFQLGIIHMEKTEGHVLNVHHLETACGMDLMGLIGFEVLRNYELLFDFPNHKIQAFKSGTAKNAFGAAPLTSFSFTLCGHVPVFLAKVGDKRAFLGLDSGAEVNLLNAKYLDKISPANLSNIQSELLTGLDNMSKTVIAADVKMTHVKGEQLPEMRYVFADLDRLRSELDTPIDGLLGVPFFKDRVISIDYGQKKIRIWQ